MIKGKTVWFTTKTGGQLGLRADNIKYLCSDYVLTIKNVRYDLDPTKWTEHRFALVNGCV
jgi:hypothetical protein